MKKSFLFSTGLVAMLAAVVYGSSAANSSEGDMLQVYKAGSKNAVDTVTSCRGKIHLDCQVFNSDGAILIRSGSDYSGCFSGKDYRFSLRKQILDKGFMPETKTQPTVGKVTEYELLVKDQKRTVFAEKHGKRAHISWSDSRIPDEYTVDLFIRNLGFAGASVPSFGFVDLDKWGLYPNPGVSSSTITIAGEETIGDSLCKIIERSDYYAGSGMTLIYRIWIDPAKGFMVPRIRFSAVGGVYVEEKVTAEENVELKEYLPGIWYSAKSVFDNWSITKNGKSYKSSSSVITFAPDFQVNTQLTAKDLTLDLPSGTTVLDETCGTKFRIP